MNQLLNTRGQILSIIAKQGGVWYNDRKFQTGLASQLGISFFRVRDLISELKQDGLVFTESHGKYGVNPKVMQFFQSKHKGM